MVEALRQSQRRLLEAQRLARLGNWYWDIRSGDVQWSDEVFRIFQLDPAVFKPHIDSILSLSPWPEDHERGQELIHKAILSHEPGHYEQRFLLPDGSTGYYISTFQGIYDDKGELTAIEGVIQDISERKRSEQALKESQTLLRTLIRTIPDLVWLKDRQGRFLACNYQFERLFAAREEDIIGKTDYDFVSVELADFFRHNDQKAIDAGKPVTNEEEVVFADNGQHRILETIKTPMFGSDGQLIGVLGIGRDITERKRAEGEHEKLQRQLIQANKMESIGRLAGGVAHDFNNMLSVILGYAEMAMKQLDAAQPMYDDLQEIRKAAERSADITRQLLAFARRQTVLPRRIDLNSSLEGMLKMLQRLIGENIELVWRPGPDLAPVLIDPSQVDQMLANLCVNARDAIAPATGRVTIETSMTRLDDPYCAGHPGCSPGWYVLLTVSDNGCGMDRDTLAYIFEPFFTTKKLDKGTGLGLATVYGIVRQNAGFINVYSEPGLGTTFRIYLPPHTDRSGPQETDSAVLPDERGSETILLVEDEPAILTMVAQMLMRLGYTVMPAPAPGPAIQMASLRIDPIQLLITDVIMPDMNGRDLARALQTGHPEIRTLFMSGYTGNVIAHHGVLDPGVHFIQKPFSLSQLAAKVRAALGS